MTYLSHVKELIDSPMEERKVRTHNLIYQTGYLVKAPIIYQW